MAKEQWHKWGRTAIMVLTLTFVCGITYQRIDVTETGVADVNKRADKIDDKIDDIKDDVVVLKLQYKDIEALATSTNSILQELKTGQITDRVIQNKMVTDVAVISEKVNTSTKD